MLRKIKAQTTLRFELIENKLGITDMRVLKQENAQLVANESCARALEIVNQECDEKIKSLKLEIQALSERKTNDHSKLLELEEALQGSRKQLEVSRTEFEKPDALMHASDKENQERVATLESSLSDAMQRLQTVLSKVTSTQRAMIRLRRENAQRHESERKQKEADIHHVVDVHRGEQLLRLIRKKRDRRSKRCSRDSDDSDTSKYVARYCKTPKKKRSKHKRSPHNSYRSNYRDKIIQEQLQSTRDTYSRNYKDRKVKRTRRDKASSRKNRRRRRTSGHSDTSSSS